MFLIREARPSDLKAVLGLAGHLNSYNLPADKNYVTSLLAASTKSFAGKAGRKEDARYLFVAEELKTKKVVGSSLIIARHGTPSLPHLSFKLEQEAKTSRFLSRRVEHLTLKLKADTRGFTEIGGLVVLPEYRRHPEKIGKQLSYARFEYIARYPKKFMPRLIVEYLPKLDPQKGNRLWELVGQKFTGLSYARADRLSAVSKEFILSLFPKDKIYACFLPDGVVRELGKPGEGAKASVGMLEKIGFRFLNQIDPFDGGPHYGAGLPEIVRRFR
jgi:arginine N-succinyltransferase